MNASIKLSSDPKLLANSPRSARTNLPGDVKPVRRHGPGRMPSCTIESIHVRAETVTPILQAILDQRPAEHWEYIG
jgi:hypothetical protein